MERKKSPYFSILRNCITTKPIHEMDARKKIQIIYFSKNLLNTYEK